MPCPPSHPPVARPMSLSCALDPNAGCPNVEPVRHLATPQSHPCGATTSRASVSRSREARLTIPVSQDHKAGPKHGSTIPIFQKPRGCPRDLRNFEPPDPAKKSDIRTQFPRLRSHPTRAGHPSIETAQPTSFPAGQAAPLHRSPARLRPPSPLQFPKAMMKACRTGCSSSKTQSQIQLPRSATRPRVHRSAAKHHHRTVARPTTKPHARMPMLEALRLAQLPMRKRSLVKQSPA